MIQESGATVPLFFVNHNIYLSELKGYTMKKVVVGLVLALTVAACSAPTSEPVETMVTPEPTSQKL